MRVISSPSRNKKETIGRVFCGEENLAMMKLEGLTNNTSNFTDQNCLQRPFYRADTRPIYCSINYLIFFNSGILF